MAGSEEGGSDNKSGNPMRWWDDASYKKNSSAEKKGIRNQGQARDYEQRVQEVNSEELTLRLASEDRDGL